MSAGRLVGTDKATGHPVVIAADPLTGALVSSATLNGNVTASTEFAEDTAHTTGDKGGMVLAVRRDADTTLVDATGDYAPLQVNADGRLKVVLPAGGGGLTDAELRATPVDVNPTDRALRDNGKVDVATLDQYTPVDTDPGAGTENSLPVAVRQNPNFTQAIDYDGNGNPIYVGLAVPGVSNKANAVWQIKKLTYSGLNLTDVQWADGNLSFDNIWNNRAALSYS